MTEESNGIYILHTENNEFRVVECSQEEIAKVDDNHLWMVEYFHQSDVFNDFNSAYLAACQMQKAYIQNGHVIKVVYLAQYKDVYFPPDTIDRAREVLKPKQQQFDGDPRITILFADGKYYVNYTDDIVCYHTAKAKSLGEALGIICNTGNQFLEGAM